MWHESPLFREGACLFKKQSIWKCRRGAHCRAPALQNGTGGALAHHSSGEWAAALWGAGDATPRPRGMLVKWARRLVRGGWKKDCTDVLLSHPQKVGWYIIRNAALRTWTFGRFLKIPRTVISPLKKRTCLGKTRHMAALALDTVSLHLSAIKL